MVEASSLYSVTVLTLFFSFPLFFYFLKVHCNDLMHYYLLLSFVKYRFSCLGREYYYLFWGENLNLLVRSSSLSIITFCAPFIGIKRMRNLVSLLHV